VESGLITFIGATTENPSFEVVGALLSRAQVYVLKSLDEAGSRRPAATGAGTGWVGHRRGRGGAQAAPRPGRRRRPPAAQPAGTAFHRLEGRRPGQRRCRLRRRGPGSLRRRFDKGGDAFYDQISALHKSVRGSSPDASLYWFMRMLDGGADPRYMGRRIIRMAVEDIGLADPRALTTALDAVATYERLGSPEGELALAQAVLYLACAPKSNAVYTAYQAARTSSRKTVRGRCRCICAMRRPSS
jgi:putative ATPase